MRVKFLKNTIMVLLLMLCVGAVAADQRARIGEAGDARWNSVIRELESQGEYVERVSTPVIVNNYRRYHDKVMLFPEIDFGNLITDRRGNRYYWYGTAGTNDLYVIKHDQAIQDQLYRLNNALGGVQGEYEVLGKIVDALEWWGNIVLMETVAMRIPGVATVVVEDGSPRLVGQRIMDDWMSEQVDAWASDVPRGAESVPAGLDPESVAKWFLYYGSEVQDQTIWAGLVTVDDRAVDSNGNLQGRGRSWWRMVSNPDREYYFVREDTGRSTDTRRVFMYQFRQGGEDVGAARPMTIQKERNGEWRVSSF